MERRARARYGDVDIGALEVRPAGARNDTVGRDDVEDATEHNAAALVSFEAPPRRPQGTGAVAWR